MNLATLLPVIAYLPSQAGLPTSTGGSSEILGILLCLALIVAGGSAVVAILDGLAARSAPRGLASLRSVIIRHLSISKGK